MPSLQRCTLSKALNAGWDEELLTIELAEPKLEGFDLSLTGFGEVARRAAR
jgi:hypothetical protein